MLTWLWYLGDDWLSEVLRMYWVGHIPLGFAFGAEIVFWVVVGALAARRQ